MTPSKICSKCRTTKPRTDFYKDERKRGGLTSQCKDCVKARQNAWNRTEAGKASLAKFRASNPDKMRAYVAAYGRSEKGKTYRKKYRATEKGKALKKRYLHKRYGGEDGLRKARRLKLDASETPERTAAWAKTNRAIRSGKLIPQPCACGNPKSQAHHEDYSKPLDVMWLCASCHQKRHYQKRTVSTNVEDY